MQIIFIYMHATSSVLKKLNSGNHAALRFITSSGSRPHHWILHEPPGWPLYTREGKYTG